MAAKAQFADIIAPRPEEAAKRNGFERLLLLAPPSFQGRLRATRGHAARHLARHGIPVTADVATTEGLDTGTLLLNRIAENGHDGLLIGGYDRSVLREQLFGGVTWEMLHRASLPVPLSH